MLKLSTMFSKKNSIFFCPQKVEKNTLKSLFCTQKVYVLKLLIIFILIKFLVLIQYVQNSNFAFALPLKV